MTLVSPENKKGSPRGEPIRKYWWVIGHPRPIFRRFTAGFPAYIATLETSKHRVFTVLPEVDAPDSALVTFSLSDAALLGVLSSRVHTAWALATGGRLGVGNDSRYNKTRCFDTYPFPDATLEQYAKIRNMAEKLDAHRKRQQIQYPELTVTGMYNVLEKLRTCENLTDKDMDIHTKALVSRLRELHDDLDSAVFAAYGWDDLAKQLVGLPGATTPLPDKPEAQTEAEEELLLRLVELNSQRAAEEARGQIRWLRPDYQNPRATKVPEQAEAELDAGCEANLEPAVKVKKIIWPKGMREQIAVVRNTLGSEAMTLESLVAQFSSPKATTPLIVEALAALEDLGMVSQEEEFYRLAS